MKELVLQMLRESDYALQELKKSNMTLTERLCYEKARQKAEFARTLIYKFLSDRENIISFLSEKKNDVQEFSDRSLDALEKQKQLTASLAEACQWAITQFKKLADEGKYPEFMLSQNGGSGITPIVESLSKYKESIKGK